MPRLSHHSNSAELPPSDPRGDPSAQVLIVALIGGTSSFQFELPEIFFTLQVPRNPNDIVTSIEGGGGASDEQLPDTAIETGCDLTTGIADGLDEIDSSGPQGTDATLGFSAETATHWIAQAFSIPGNLPQVLGSIRVFAYQAGMPTTAAPTVQSVTVRIYTGPPWLPQSQLLHSSTTLGADVDADWVDVDRTASPGADDGSKALMELWWDQDVVLPPGPKWLAVSITGDPAYGEVQMPPCPYADPADNAWSFNASSLTWSQLQDAGSGRPVSFPIDVFVGAAAVAEDAPALPTWGPAALILMLLLAARWVNVSKRGGRSAHSGTLYNEA